MLVLSRRSNESIKISDSIEITVIEVKGDLVKLGITAPKDVKVYRSEVYKAIQEEMNNAVKLTSDDMKNISDILSFDIKK